MPYVIATRHFMGLGFAVRLQEEGHDVVLGSTGTSDRRVVDRYDLVGRGLVPVLPLATLIADRARYRDWTWLWDENHSVEENELLRREGYRVFGGGEFANRMEHDRGAAVAFVSGCGLRAPPSTGFERVDDAVRFLERHPETAYVYKPDVGESFETWLPQSDDAASANLELRQHLRSLRATGRFVLQELKDGVEADVEVWFVNGTPRFAFLTLESKKRLVGDLGDLTGCAFDFTVVVPLESRAVRESVGPLFPAYHAMAYTGLADANFVVSRDGLWFLEKSERFGYNAHPNLFWTLNRAPLGETLSSLVEGRFEPDFAPGFGASLSMYMEHPAPGKRILLPDGVARGIYLVDVYRDGDAPLTAGYNEAICIATAHGYTIPTAWDAAVARAWQVKFAGRAFRLDGGGTDFPSSPLRRFEALDAMGWL